MRPTAFGLFLVVAVVHTGCQPRTGDPIESEGTDSGKVESSDDGTEPAARPTTTATRRPVARIRAAPV